MRGTAGDVWVVQPYQPARWLPSPHGHTVAGRLLRRPRPLPFRRERIELPDGDFVDLDHPPLPAGADAATPLVLLMHGLEGSARRGYAINVYRALAQRGVRAVGLNFRSCSGEPNRSAGSYHSGATADILHVLRLLAQRYPRAPRGAIGFSLGGNALLKLLGEQGAAGRGLVRAAVAVSVPYDLGAGADALAATRLGRAYSRVFLKTLSAKVTARAALLDGACDLDRVRAARTFRDFDDAATAPLHGFDGAADYYERCSSSAFLPDIAVPTLLLHAADDPFLPVRCFPYAAVSANPCLHAVVTPTGGHVGFIEGWPWAPSFWAEREAARFLADRLLAESDDAGDAAASDAAASDAAAGDAAAGGGSAGTTGDDDASAGDRAGEAPRVDAASGSD
jgi:uncharacterized protein